MLRAMRTASEPRRDSTLSRHRLGVLSAGIALTLGALAAPVSAEETRSASRSVLGVEITLAVRGLPDEAAAAAADAGFAEALRVAKLLWLRHETSEVGILNHVPMGVEVAFAPDTLAGLALAIEVAAASEGAWDPTLPPLLDLWGITSEKPTLPRPTDIDAAVRKVYWDDVAVDREAGSASRASRRTRIDLDEVGIGIALDRAAAALRNAGAKAGHARTSTLHSAFGGGWSVALPGEPSGPATIRLDEGGLAIVEPRVDVTLPDGTRVHDRIDGRSGRPNPDLAWVAVAAPDAGRAAGFAAAVFAMGKPGRGLVEKRAGLQAVVVARDGEVWRSPGVKLGD